MIRLLLSESVVIAAAGGALGVCATFGLRALIYRNVPEVVYGPFQPVASVADGSASVAAERALVDRGYFATLGVRIHAGRGFALTEMTTRARVLLVDDTLADRLWPDGGAVGAHAWIDKTPYEIIGIVAGHSTDPLARPAPRFFLPLPDQSRPGRMDFVVRASGDPAPLLQPIRRAIRALEPGYEVTSAYTFDAVIEGGAREIMVVAYAMGPLIGMGLFLTATGVFGVLAFTIARRSKELALRVAIGATQAQIVWLVSRRTLQIVAAGTALGTATAFALTRVVRAAGGSGTPFDTPGWLAFALPVATIVIVSSLATCIPAVRAVRIQPADVLRTE